LSSRAQRGTSVRRRSRQLYFVTESGITVLTRNYSLFENPVTVGYITPE